MQPRRRHNIRPALFLQEQRQPQRQVGTVRRAEGRRRALSSVLEGVPLQAGTTRWDALTERRSMPSSRWRGTTVTSSISLRKETSEGTSPVGSGNAIVVGLGVGGWWLESTAVGGFCSMGAVHRLPLFTMWTRASSIVQPHQQQRVHVSPASQPPKATLFLISRVKK